MSFLSKVDQLALKSLNGKGISLVAASSYKPINDTFKVHKYI